MKKILLALMALVSVTAAHAQLPEGSTAPDFTLTDINGNSFTLSEALADGKTVIIDFSATWCPPCWAYHTTGEMERLFEEHGPAGTCSDDFIVLYIEGDTQTTLADLQGETAASQGNWLEGTGYPIFNPTTNTVMNDYQISAFPTIYKICPDGIVSEVGTASMEGFVALGEECYETNDAKLVANPGLACANTTSPSVILENRSLSNLTSATIHYSANGGAEQTFDWTGAISAGQSVEVVLPEITLEGAGVNNLEFRVENINGGSDTYGSNNCTATIYNVNFSAGVNAPYSQIFTSPAFPYANWVLQNADNLITWARVGTGQGSLKYDCFNYSLRGAEDIFIPQAFNLVGLTNASLSFKVAHKRYSLVYTDGLRVEVSADCGASWTEVYFKEGDDLATGTPVQTAFTPSATEWRTECIDLNQYIGNDKLYVRFTGINDFGNNIYVDEINVSDAVCLVNVDENSNTSNLAVYPNPVNDIANVTFSVAQNADVVIEVVSLVGQKVISINKGNLPAGNHIHQLDVENLGAGIYLVNVIANGNVSSMRVTVSK